MLNYFNKRAPDGQSDKDRVLGITVNTLLHLQVMYTFHNNSNPQKRETSESMSVEQYAPPLVYMMKLNVHLQTMYTCSIKQFY
jgi:hypothetical protein